MSLGVCGGSKICAGCLGMGNYIVKAPFKHGIRVPVHCSVWSKFPTSPPDSAAEHIQRNKLLK